MGTVPTLHYDTVPTFKYFQHAIHKMRPTVYSYKFIRSVQDHQPKMDPDTRVKAYKYVAYAAVSFCVFSVLSVCITLPMVYNYVNHVKRQMDTEINFCQVRIENERDE